VKISEDINCLWCIHTLLSKYIYIITVLLRRLETYMMEAIPIYSPIPGCLMRIACFMSGSGTNTRRIIEQTSQPNTSYTVDLIFTDVKDETFDKNGKKICRALDISREYGIAYECIDIKDFYLQKGQKSKKDLSLRPEFDRLVVNRLGNYKINLIVLAGYMSIQTKPLLDDFSGRIINVHPADLSLSENNKRKYIGIHPVRDAILAGEKSIRSTSHVVREEVDGGEILITSKPTMVNLPENVKIEDLKEDKALQNRIVEDYQDKLKINGDWIIYPLTVQMIGQGRFALCNGIAYLDGNPLPKGLRL
jgi:phosphoribosylglycinamide formyltransferase-1